MAEVICRLDELVDRQCREFELKRDGEPIPAFLLRLGDEVVAYRNHCPHTGAPLNWNPDDFLSFEKGFIQCSIHGALFSLENGYCVHGPCQGQSLQAVEVVLKEGEILIPS